MERFKIYCTIVVVTTFFRVLAHASAHNVDAQKMSAEDAAAKTSDRADAASVVTNTCICRCYYQGGCTDLFDISWVVSSCSECRTSMCNAHIDGKDVRRRAVLLVNAIEANTSMDTFTMSECEAIALLEKATCAGKSCRHATTLKAECYSREGTLIKYIVLSFVVVTILAFAFGLFIEFQTPLRQACERFFNKVNMLSEHKHTHALI